MSPIPQTTLSGSAKHLQIGNIGYGTMGLDWTPKPTSEEDGLEVMKASVDAGCTFWNTGCFYGMPEDPHANLKRIRRFFDKYPDYKSKVVLSVKGGMDIENIKAKGMGGMMPDASIENLRLDLERARETLNTKNGGKEIDVYEMARIDVKTSVEETMKNLLQLSQEEKLFHHISLSEVGAETIRKAAAVAPIACVEVEYSPWELSIETNGVLDACKELSIPIIAYSPVGRGFLTGGVKSRDDFPEGDIRLHQDRFSEENFSKNLELVADFEKAAKEKGCTPAQLTLAWLVQQSPNGLIVPIPGTSKASRVKENAESANIKLSEEDLKKFRAVIDETSGKVQGGRYNEMARKHQPLFG